MHIAAEFATKFENNYLQLNGVLTDGCREKRTYALMLAFAAVHYERMPTKTLALMDAEVHTSLLESQIPVGCKAVDISRCLGLY